MNPAASPSPSQPGCDGKAGALLPPDSAPADPSTEETNMTAQPLAGELVAQDEPRTFTPAVAPTTPMEMVAHAVANGASIETLERLMNLQERYEASQARRAFDEAVADAKAEIGPIGRNKTGHNAKKYADFAAIASAVDPVLSKHGLSYRFQTAQGDRIAVTCILSHRGGHSEQTTLEGPPDAGGSKNAIQAIGSTLTYLQRYSLVQMLGLAAADDDDARSAAKDTEVVSDEQAAILRQLITDTGTDIGTFLTYAKAECIPDILASKFPRLKAELERKKAKGAAK